MDTTKLLASLVEQFYRITNKMNKMKNIPLSFDGTELINTAAIHLIDMIGKHEEWNLTEIADAMGVTKGATSQMASKLEAKDLIIKAKNTGNDKDIKFCLTEEGRKVYDGHEKLHEELYSKISKILEEFTDKDIKKIMKALNQIDQCMSKYNHL